MENIKKGCEIIAYTVEKTSNSSLYISIQNGEVVVKAPMYYTGKQIQEIIEEKKNWILKHLNEYEQHEKIKEQKNNIQPIAIFGKEYEIFIKYDNIKNPTLNLLKNYVEIILPKEYINKTKTKIIDATTNKLYKSIAKEELEILLEDIRHILGFAPEDVKIQILDNDYLAKCVNNVITINPQIIQYNKEIIRFIIFHQFCHLKYKNHTKSFEEIMEKYIFNYDEIKKQVKYLKF